MIQDFNAFKMPSCDPTWSCKVPKQPLLYLPAAFVVCESVEAGPLCFGVRKSFFLDRKQHRDSCVAAMCAFQADKQDVKKWRSLAGSSRIRSHDRTARLSTALPIGRPQCEFMIICVVHITKYFMIPFTIGDRHFWEFGVGPLRRLSRTRVRAYG